MDVYGQLYLPSHGGNTGSNPVGDASYINKLEDERYGISAAYEGARLIGTERSLESKDGPIPPMRLTRAQYERRIGLDRVRGGGLRVRGHNPTI